jgi:hypothetical protein
MAFDPNKYIIQLKGKPYLQVAHRLLWLQSERPEWSIETTVLQTEPYALVKAMVFDETGRLRATGHGSAPLGAKAVYAGREIEKAETASIGRALAVVGFGTQFALEDFEDAENEHLADAPVNRSNAPQVSDGETLEVELHRNSGGKTKSGEPFAVYTTDDQLIKVNVFDGDRVKFQGLPQEARYPDTFNAIVVRKGQFWNLQSVTSF